MANRDPEYTDSTINAQARYADKAISRAVARNHPAGDGVSNNPLPSESLAASDGLGRGTKDDWASRLEEKVLGPRLPKEAREGAADSSLSWGGGYGKTLSTGHADTPISPGVEATVGTGGEERVTATEPDNFRPVTPVADHTGGACSGMDQIDRATKIADFGSGR
jgi:hypothetical protein